MRNLKRALSTIVITLTSIATLSGCGLFSASQKDIDYAVDYLEEKYGRDVQVVKSYHGWIDESSAATWTQVKCKFTDNDETTVVYISDDSMNDTYFCDYFNEKFEDYLGLHTTDDIMFYYSSHVTNGWSNQPADITSWTMREIASDKDCALKIVILIGAYDAETAIKYSERIFNELDYLDAYFVRINTFVVADGHTLEEMAADVIEHENGNHSELGWEYEYSSIGTSWYSHRYGYDNDKQWHSLYKHEKGEQATDYSELIKDR